MRRAILQTTREDFWKNGDAKSETRVRIEKKLKKKMKKKMKKGEDRKFVNWENP